MDKGIPDRELLIEYLLGKLPEDKRSEITGRYFADDDFFDELLDVENELLEKYARGVLDERLREDFKLYLERLPDGRQKEATVRALLQFTDVEKAKSQQIQKGFVERTRRPGWGPLRNRLSKPQAMVRYLAASSLVALAIALLLMFAQVGQLRRHNDQLREEIGQLEKEKEEREQNAGTSQSGAEYVRQLEEQLKLEQQVSEAQAQRLAGLQPATPVVALWMLTPAFRSASSPDEVTLPRSAKFVSIAIPIDSEEQIHSYRAIIQTTTGEIRREQTGLRAKSGSKSVTLKIPADYFKETSYKLTLVGKGKDALELAQDYYFSVVRK